jgi:hypothetical protein
MTELVTANSITATLVVALIYFLCLWAFKRWGYFRYFTPSPSAALCSLHLSI